MASDPNKYSNLKRKNFGSSSSLNNEDKVIAGSSIGYHSSNISCSSYVSYLSLVYRSNYESDSTSCVTYSLSTTDPNSVFTSNFLVENNSNIEAGSGSGLPSSNGPISGTAPMANMQSLLNMSSNTSWTPEEQAILDEGLNDYYGHMSNLVCYAKIAANLSQKRILDVALRHRWMKLQGQDSVANRYRRH